MSESQQEIEVILVKQLASYLATPIFVVDPNGDLVYFNEPAEALLGQRFDESGAMPQSEWATAFTPTDDGGRQLPEASIPLSIALNEHRAAQDTFWITGRDGRRRHLFVIAFPLIGQHERVLGAVTLFWEESDSRNPDR